MSASGTRVTRFNLPDEEQSAVVPDSPSSQADSDEDALNAVLQGLSLSPTMPKKVAQVAVAQKTEEQAQVPAPAIQRDESAPVVVKADTDFSCFLQHPFRTYDTPIKPNIEKLAAQPSPYKPSASASYFAQFKDEKVSFAPDPPHKLIVPSLNGDLVLRQMREVHQRPFLQNLMQFLLPGKSDITKQCPKMDVHFWSSAMPHNVKMMLDRYFMKWRGDILGTWTRENLDLDVVDYLGNPKTYKDLEKLLRHLRQRQRTQSAFSVHRLPKDAVLTMDHVVLVEDSCSKTRLQPLNHLPITEYTLEEYENTIRTLRREKAKRSSGEDVEDNDYDSATDFNDLPSGLKPKIDVAARVKLLRLLYDGDATGFFTKYISDSKGYRARGDVGLQIDAILLAVIGIIAELQDVASIPVWLASGGLMPDIDHTFTGAIAARGWGYVVRLDSGMRSIPPPKLDVKDHTVPDTLPFDEQHKNWYDSPIHMLYWIRKGLQALDTRGIAVDHGMD